MQTRSTMPLLVAAIPSSKLNVIILNKLASFQNTVMVSSKLPESKIRKRKWLIWFNSEIHGAISSGKADGVTSQIAGTRDLKRSLISSQRMMESFGWTLKTIKSSSPEFKFPKLLILMSTPLKKLKDHTLSSRSNLIKQANTHFRLPNSENAWLHATLATSILMEECFWFALMKVPIRP